MNRNQRNAPTIIYLTGIDGSGKSTVTEALAKELREKGYDVDILWLRFNHVLSKPLLGLCRLLGYTKYETCDGIRVGYHDFYKSPIISYAFIFFQYLDAARVKYTKILPTCRKPNKVLILDRYVYDILIDIAVDTRKNNLLHSWIGERFRSLLPKGTVTILVKRELQKILEVRPEGKVDRNFELRFSHFEKLNDSFDINIINNKASLEALLSSAKKVAGLNK